jgi:microcystin-dependent protein
MVKITGSAIEFSADNQQTSVYPAIGTILLWGGYKSSDLINTDYLLCDGSQLLKLGQYSDLFDIIGYRYGGSGNNFNLPDLRERIPLGANNPTSVAYTSPTSIYPSPYFGGTNKLNDNRYYPHTHTFILSYFTAPLVPKQVERFGVDADRIGMDDYRNTNTNSGFISNIGDGNPTSSEIYYPEYTLVNYIIKAKTTLYTS